MPRMGAAAARFGSHASRRRTVARARRRSLRRPLLFALAALCAAALVYELVERTPISAVRHVQIAGVRGVDARAIDRALTGRALGMSTLAVDEGALRAAVARFPVVRSISAEGTFPHTLRIVVVEQLPAAVVQVGSITTVAAADGRILGPSYVSSRLPRVAGDLRIAGRELHGPHVAALLAIAAAAPAPLAAAVESVYFGSHGVTASLRGGLRAYFGDGTLARAKWISLVRVLTAPSSHGASSIDVRVPGRPAAAFNTASGEAGGATSAPLTGEALISALTASLAAGGSNLSAPPTSTVPTQTTSEPQQPATESQQQSAAPGEAQTEAGG